MPSSIVTAKGGWHPHGNGWKHFKNKVAVTIKQIVFSKAHSFDHGFDVFVRNPFLHKKGPEQRLRARSTINRRQISMRIFFMLKKNQKLLEMSPYILIGFIYDFMLSFVVDLPFSMCWCLFDLRFLFLCVFYILFLFPQSSYPAPAGYMYNLCAFHYRSDWPNGP